MYFVESHKICDANLLIIFFSVRDTFTCVIPRILAVSACVRLLKYLRFMRVRSWAGSFFNASRNAILSVIREISSFEHMNSENSVSDSSVILS